MPFYLLTIFLYNKDVFNQYSFVLQRNMKYQFNHEHTYNFYLKLLMKFENLAYECYFTVSLTIM